MNWLNPLRCTTESTRRLSVGLMIFALLAWVVWVGVVSDGFSIMGLNGWLVFVGVPISVYIALLLVSPIRRASKIVRVLLSVNLMWTFLLGAWGYVWEWENVFTFDRYLGLFIFPTIGTWLGLLLWKWSRSAPSVSIIDSNITLENGHQHQASASNMTVEFCKRLKGYFVFTADRGRFRLFAIGIGISLLLASPLYIAQKKKEVINIEINDQISTLIGEIAALCEASKHVATSYCRDLDLKEDIKRTCTNNIASLIPYSMPSRNDAVIATESVIASDEYKFLINNIKDKIDKSITAARLQPNYSEAVLCNGYAEDYNNLYDQLISKLDTIKF